MVLHGSCAARGGDAVLLLGPPGSGKSDLMLRLIERGWGLVADDQVVLTAHGDDVQAAPPPALAGLLEVRGVGVLRDLPMIAGATVRLVARLVPRPDVPRLPERAVWAGAGPPVPQLALHAFDAATPARLGVALDVVLGRRHLLAGAGPGAA